MSTRLPPFSLPDQEGHIRTDNEFKQGWLALYFYPKDNTSGCTLQAQGFRDKMKDFAKRNCKIVGVSRDSVTSHDGFCQKQGINFTLLSDEKGELCNAMSTWVEKSMYGKKYMGIERSTFLFHDGLLVREWRKVKVPGHVAEVMAAIK
ncbi:MAG: peroxiredoxin [Alphaproteobacteria bacterium]|nr:peroxiredoxin [Alphaproteobacteria bacterium]